MNKIIRTIGLFFATAYILNGSAAFADSSMPATVDTAQTGAWIGDFVTARDYAFSTGTPLVMVWSNHGCSYCSKFKTALNGNEFKTWMKNAPYVFCIVEGDAEAKKFAQNAGGYASKTVTEWPIIALLWLKGGNCRAVSNFTGRASVRQRDGTIKDYGLGTKFESQLAPAFINAIEATFAEYGKYNGGKFTVGNTVGDRLEAEETTEWVDVLLERDAALELEAADETLSIAYPKAAGSETAVRKVAWAEGESEKRVRVTFAELDGFVFSVGGEVRLALADAGGATLDESLIALVKRGNSPKNPVWIGKKMADELAWGEWTMDLDVAAAKVAAAKAKSETAHLLVSFGGSIWCPDCAKTDRYIVETDEFKAWALANNVACVAIDIPNLSAANPLAGPCLLTRDKREVSAAYSAADPDHGTVQSGAGYLSRWMIEDDAAADVLARNRQLVGTNTKDGGWNRPERANQYRTGVPVFALVDASTMKVISRIELFSASSPVDSNALAGHIRRFDELLAVANAVDAAFEEDNRDISTMTAGMALAVGGAAVDGEVSGGDLVDMFAVTGVKFDERTTLTATPADAPNVNWQLSLVQKGDGTAKTVVTTNGTGVLSVSADLNASDGGNVYAKVEITGLGSTAASFGADVDATIDYSLLATSAATPGTVGFDSATAEAFIPNGRSFSVSVSRGGGRTGAVKARVYLADAGDAAEYGFEETNLVWAAGETGARTVPFEAWRPGDTLASGTFTLGIEIVEGGDAVGTDSCEVTLSDTTAPCFASFDIKADAHLTFAAGEQIPLMNVKAGTAAMLKKTSGTLPKGMRLAYDRKTGTVTLKGTPKAAGTFTATYTVTQNRVTGLPATITITVDEPKAVNPFLGVKRAEQGMPLVEEVADGTNVVSGTLSISITAANKVKAKLQTADGVSTTCSGTWTDFDSATGVASLKFADKKGRTVALEMGIDGIIRADINDGEFFGEIAAPDTDFNDWAGSYTVTFPENPSEDGDASMAFATMVVSADGKVKWSATLSNAQTASGTSRLFGRDGDVAYVALFKSAKSYMFSSLLKVRRGGGATWDDQTENQIIHSAAGVATYESVEGVETLRAAFGGWWAPNAAPTYLLAAFDYSDKLAFESTAFDARGALATAKGFNLEAVVRGDRLSYTKKTGAFSGTVSIPGVNGKTVKATVKGVLLPGWYSCGCEEPAEGEDALVTRPFGAGIAYYKVRAGRVTTVVSVPVYLKTMDLTD